MFTRHFQFRVSYQIIMFVGSIDCFCYDELCECDFAVMFTTADEILAQNFTHIVGFAVIVYYLLRLIVCSNT
jgi:hypothetical protein